MTQTTMRDVFRLLGFEEDWQGTTEQQPAYRANLGNVEFTASEVTGKAFRPVFLLTGLARSRRSVGMINFEIPLEVASIEQGVALIAHAVGQGVEPDRPTAWLELGRKWRNHLPWANPT